MGAAVSDLDLRQLSCEAQAEIRHALVNRKVLVFPKQNLTADQYVEFMRIFGVPVQEDMAVDEGHPLEVGAIHIRYQERQTINFWHMDHSFRELPTRVLSLYAKLLPPVGGDTLFASLEAAYDGLPRDMKNMIKDFHCYHRVTRTQNTKRRHSREEADAMESLPPVLHPLVGLNPDNGRKYLFVNVPIYCRSIAELPTSAGDALLSKLYLHVQRPEFHLRITWAPDTLIVWENKYTLHYPVFDYFPYERKLWRIVIEATEADRPQQA